MKSVRKTPFFSLLILLVSAFVYRDVLGRELTEWAFNHNTHALFSRTVKIGDFHLDRKGQIRLGKITGNLKTANDPLPIEIEEIISDDSVFNYFSPEGVIFRFHRLKPAESDSPGISGRLRLKGGKAGFYDLRGSLLGLGLEEIRALHPENLKNATGEMKGTVSVRQNENQEPSFSAEIRIEEPGGEITSKFFDIFTPYLPQRGEALRKKRAASTKEVVRYVDALLRFEMAESDRMKIFLHMRVPDYNLNLNLNLEVRIDEKNGFYELAKILGL